MQSNKTMYGFIPMRVVIASKSWCEVEHRPLALDQPGQQQLDLLAESSGGDRSPGRGSSEHLVEAGLLRRKQGFAGERARLVSCLTEGIVVFHSLSRYNRMANN